MRLSLLVCRYGLAVAGAVLAAAGAAAQIDRHPELKSRAVAWTEFDGSYLVDTNSRAEMLDFFWTVLNRPYPSTGWTGSLTPPVAGGTSELWRIREYAQLNAYRALNGSPPMAEDPTKLDYVQAGALLLALNPDKPFGHYSDNSWTGYNETGADALQKCSLTGTSGFPLRGAADNLVQDDGSPNAASVGHRSYLLHDRSITGALGAASNIFNDTACVWRTPIEYGTTSCSYFVAYPAPGWMPLVLLTGRQSLRWSFVPTNDWTSFRVGTDADFFQVDPRMAKRDATITAKVNGVSVPVHNLCRNNPPWPLTWDFESKYLDLEGGQVPEGTKVEITVHDVAELIPGTTYVLGYHDYAYTVTFFDQNTVAMSTPSPKTPLVNLSTRAQIGDAEQQLIAGFSISGTAPVRVAVRTQGPALTKFGIPNASRSTQIKVYDSSNDLVGGNAGWKQHPNWRLLRGLGVSPSDDNEAGMVLTLWPGTYTAVVSDNTGTNGTGIVEVFNIDSLAETELVNLSTRGVIGTDQAPMIAGMTLSKPRTILIRTQGPALAKYGIVNPVSDTVLTIVAQADGRTVAQNDDWELGSGNERLKTDLAAFAPTDPHESAIVLALPAGAYTALVRSKGTPGVGIVEVFELDE